MFIFLIWLDDIIFSNLTKNVLKTFKLEKEFKIFILAASNMIFLTKSNHTFLSTNGLFAQITFPCLL